MSRKKGLWYNAQTMFSRTKIDMKRYFLLALVAIVSLAGQHVVADGMKCVTPAKRLTVVDVSGVTPEERLFAVSVQGIVNQARPRIYLIGRESDKFWLERLKSRELVSDVRELQSIEELAEAYKYEVKGLVVYDEDIPDSINAATMIAATRKFAIASPEIAERLGTPVKADLRGKWQDSGEAYKWCYENLWDELSHDLASWADPSEMFFMQRDWLIAKKVFVFWISGEKDSMMAGADLPAEDYWTKKVLESTEGIAPVFGYPYGGEGIGLGEMRGTALTSSYGKYAVCTNFCSNLSVHSGYPTAKLEQKKREKPALDKKKAYISFVISDGDNLNVFQDAHLYDKPKIWNSRPEDRPHVVWTMSPVAAYVMPEIVRYYYESEDDSFVCGHAGAGYIYCRPFGMYADGITLEKYGKLTGEMCRTLDMSVVTMHDYLGLSACQMRQFAKGFGEIDGYLCDYTRSIGSPNEAKSYALDENTVAVHAVVTFNQELDKEARIEKAVGEIRKAAQDRPAFINCFLVNWWTEADEITEIAKRLGDEFVVVDAVNLCRLAAEHYSPVADNKNLALCAKITSPDNAGPDNSPGVSDIENICYLADGKTETYWDDEDGRDKYVLKLEFEKAVRPSKIEIVGYEQENYAPKAFTLTIDGEYIGQVKDIKYEDNVAVVDLPPSDCVEMTIEITDSYGPSPSIRELRIFE